MPMDVLANCNALVSTADLFCHRAPCLSSKREAERLAKELAERSAQDEEMRKELERMRLQSQEEMELKVQEAARKAREEAEAKAREEIERLRREWDEKHQGDLLRRERDMALEKLYKVFPSLDKGTVEAVFTMFAFDFDATVSELQGHLREKMLKDQVPSPPPLWGSLRATFNTFAWFRGRMMA